MKFVIESAGGVASRVQIEGHELRFDQPESVPFGRDGGPSPLDVMVAAVGACAHYFAAAYLNARRLPVEDLRVVIEADKDKEPVPRLARLSLRVELPPGLSEEQAKAIERIVAKCPAYGTLLHTPTVELLVERPRSEAA